MFKKIFLILIVFSPVWYSLLIGYPVISESEYNFKVKQQPRIAISKRCFAVGDFREFKACWGNSEHLKGVDLLSEMENRTNIIIPLIVTIAVVMFVVFGIIVLFNL